MIGEGQAQLEPGPRRFFIQQFKTSPITQYIFSGDGQSQPAALDLSRIGGFAPVENIKNLFTLLGRHTGPLILNIENRLFVLYLQMHPYGSVLRREFHGI